MHSSTALLATIPVLASSPVKHVTQKPSGHWNFIAAQNTLFAPPAGSAR